MRKPLYKKSHNAWHCHLNGKMTRLGETEQEAHERCRARRTGDLPGGAITA
ncbi:MAG: hypothetical protein ISR77_24785 [Pirellulaceae bacterium]|nr:hypothetical protein [Pirellulaceae bacterium]